MGLFTSAKAEAKFKKIKEEGCVVTLSVEIPAQEMTDATQTALVRVQSRAQIPGFRPGKAPLAVVTQHFTGRARQEAVDVLLRKHIPTALDSLKLRAVEAPAIEDMKWEEGQPLALTLAVEVAPTPTAKDYAKIPVKRKPRSADASAL
ncbi:MAG: trigger factor family protein, partial [Elusimicrobia bacterium]|nr:trigger factor family protein [Elusimicrobiota bacterium]